MSAVERFAGSPAEWDAFVRASPGWTHYHLYGWKHVVERLFPHECNFLCTRGRDGALTGVLPLVRVRSAIFGHYLVSLPFLNYGGPLGDRDAVRALVGHAVALADASGVGLLEMRCRDELPIDLRVSHRKITVLRDLGVESPDGLWRSLDPKVRSQVRRPQKEGVTVRFGADQVAPFYQVFARHMRDLGTPTHGRCLFDALASEFSESIWFGVAYLADQPIAAGCGFRWDAEFEMTWAASLREHNRIAPNMLLYWEFMSRCITEGVQCFNFGRCTPGSGTHRFKRQWGGRDERLWWYQHIRGHAKTPSPDDARFSWGPRIWRRLPMAIAARLGPRVVRYIP